MMSGMERMSCFRFIEKWYGEDVFLDSYESGGMERMSCFRFIREWYGEDVLF